MRRPLIAAALCIAATAVLAQGTAGDPCPLPAPNSKTGNTTRPSVAAAQPPAHGELIKTAAAGTRDAVAVAPAVRPHEEDSSQHGSTAMLLTALALMSGIALRRFGGTR